MKKKNKGFTLIELMVVVAIIGILAAVAVPRFLRFMAQSRRVETKTILSAVFIAEAATNEGLNYQAAQAAATITGYTDLYNAGFTPASPVKLYTAALAGLASAGMAGPTCTPTQSGCPVTNATYNSHVALTFIAAGTPVRGVFFNAGMCGNPDNTGVVSDQFNVSSSGGREPVLCLDDLADGTAPADAPFADACKTNPIGC